MIDRKHIGLELPVVEWSVQRDRLLVFARAIGETRPEYTDEAAARAAGHPALPAPPTFWFSAELDARTGEGMLATLGVPIARILHCEQSFTYHVPVYAGDVLTLRSHVADIVSRAGGRMEFITKDTTVDNQRGERVGEARAVILVRN
jgi:acyl dehydratase